MILLLVDVCWCSKLSFAQAFKTSLATIMDSLQVRSHSKDFFSNLRENILRAFFVFQVRRRTTELVYPKVLACKSVSHPQHVFVDFLSMVGRMLCRLKDWILTSLAFASAGFNIRHLVNHGIASNPVEI